MRKSEGKQADEYVGETFPGREDEEVRGKRTGVGSHKGKCVHPQAGGQARGPPGQAQIPVLSFGSAALLASLLPFQGLTDYFLHEEMKVSAAS